MSIENYSIVLRYTSTCIFTFFFYQFLVSLMNYYRHLQKDSFWHTSMCLITSIYCFFLSFGTHSISPKVSNMSIIILWLVAYAAYYCYLRATEVYVGRPISALKYSRLFCIVFCVIHTIGGIYYAFTGTSPLFVHRAISEESTLFTQAMEITLVPTQFTTVLGGIGLGVIAFSAFIIWRELKRLEKQEFLLKAGACFTLFVAFYDTSIALEVFGSLVPIYYLGNTFEALRFNYHYQNEARNKVNHLEYEVLRLAKVAQFGFAAGSIAHDIRNYLFVISVTIKKLLKGNTEDLHKKYQKIEKYVYKIDEITKIYMNIFKSKTSEEKSLVNISEIINEAVELVDLRKGTHTSFKIDTSECHDLEVLCNQTELTICLTNLIKNAVEEIAHLEDSWIKITTCPKSNQLRVTDSGRGISPSVASQIFDFGFSTKKNKEGQGIGLAITKQVLEKAGCQLYIDFEHPNTSFVINLNNA